MDPFNTRNTAPYSHAHIHSPTLPDLSINELTAWSFKIVRTLDGETIVASKVEDYIPFWAEYVEGRMSYRSHGSLWKGGSRRPFRGINHVESLLFYTP